jgi:hypothetical protein
MIKNIASEIATLNGKKPAKTAEKNEKPLRPTVPRVPNRGVLAVGGVRLNVVRRNAQTRSGDVLQCHGGRSTVLVVRLWHEM